jgi:replication factor A1
MEKLPTPGGIAALHANPSPDPSSDLPEIILQVVDLRPLANSSTRFT